jgi:transcriptional regulator with XRE-family HTH domain
LLGGNWKNEHANIRHARSSGYAKPEVEPETSRNFQEFVDCLLARWDEYPLPGSHWRRIRKDPAMSKAASYAQWALEPYSIGVKLRSLRIKKHLTLSRLAAETGLSTALLSKLETDRMIPTLPTLATITRVYGVGMSYFFSEPARHSLSITRKVHFEGEGRGSELLKVTPLNASAENPRLVAEMIEFAPGGGPSSADCFRESCGVVYVLEGRLQLESGGMEEILESGDCVCVGSDMTLAWSAAGKIRCRVLAVFPGQPPDEG